MSKDEYDEPKLAEKVELKEDSGVEATVNDGNLAGAETTSQAAKSSQGDLTGQVLGGRYELVEPIGVGGMGVVYKARHTVLGKMVAVKVLKSDLILSQKIRERFFREAKAAGKLAHSNLVAVHDFNVTEDGTAYIVMDLLSGESLQQLLEKEGRLKGDHFFNTIMQVTEAVAHAHESGIVHRDLKPSNIIVQKDARGNTNAKVVDFGIAKILTDNEESGQDLTQSGEVFGSPFYMSPEQCKGGKIDARSDIYSLGCIMYRCLTGKIPFEGSIKLETLMMHLSEKPKRYSEVGADDVPENLEAIVLKCLAKSPQDRFQSLNELLQELENAAASKEGAAWTEASPISRDTSKHTRADQKLSDEQTTDYGSTAALDTHATEVKVPPSASPRAKVDQSWSISNATRVGVSLFVICLLAIGFIVLSKMMSKTPPTAPPASTPPPVQTVAPAPTQSAAAPVSKKSKSEWESLVKAADDAYNKTEWQKAYPLYIEAEKTPNKAEIITSEQSVWVTGQTGNSLINLNRIGEAEPYFVKSLDQATRECGKTSKSWAAASFNLARWEGNYAGKLQPSLDRFQQTLICQKSLGMDAEMSDTLMHMGSILTQQGEYARAQKDFAQAMDIGRRVYGVDHPQMYTMKHNAAKAEIGLGNYEAGIKYLKDSFEYRNRSLGPNHPFTVHVRSDLNKAIDEFGKKQKKN